MCFQTDFDEADSCEAVLDKKYGLLLMSRVGRFLRLSSACPVISVPGGEAVSFLWAENSMVYFTGRSRIL